MNDKYKGIAEIIKLMADELDGAVGIYIDEIEKFEGNPHNPIIMPQDIREKLIEFYTSEQLVIKFPRLSNQEKFSIISLFSTFGALIGHNVLVLTTRLSLGDSILRSYFFQNPFITHTTKNYASIEDHNPGKSSHPENITISANSKFGARYDKTVLITCGKINSTVLREGRRSLNRKIKLILHC